MKEIKCPFKIFANIFVSLKGLTKTLTSQEDQKKQDTWVLCVIVTEKTPSISYWWRLEFIPSTQMTAFHLTLQSIYM